MITASVTLAPGGPFELPVSPRHAPSLPRARPCFLAKRLVPGSCFTFPAPALASAVSPRCSASCRWKLCSEARVGCTVGWSLGRARCSSKALPVTAENRSTHLLTPTPGLPRGVRAQQGREHPISNTALRRDGLPPWSPPLQRGMVERKQGEHSLLFVTRDASCV